MAGVAMAEVKLDGLVQGSPRIKVLRLRPEARLPRIPEGSPWRWTWSTTTWDPRAII